MSTPLVISHGEVAMLRAFGPSIEQYVAEKVSVFKEPPAELVFNPGNHQTSAPTDDEKAKYQAAFQKAITKGSK